MIAESHIDERIAGKPVYNFLGIGDKPDEGAERERIYKEALLKYPTPKDCKGLTAAIAAIKNEINSAEERKVATISTGGSGRVEARQIDAYTRRKDELVKYSNEWFCEQYAKDQEHQQYLSDFDSQLAAVKGITGSSDKTGTYVVIGMLVLVVAGAGFLMFKK